MPDSPESDRRDRPTYTCSACGRRAAFPEPLDGSARCPSCGRVASWKTNAFDRQRLHFCPLCGCRDLYVQKDFPHSWGLAILLVGFLVSTLFWLYYHYVHALAVLVITAAIDAVLYLFIGDAVVCYRCGTQFRGLPAAADYGAWDIEIAERYRQERKRLARDAAGTSSGPRTGISA